MRGITNVIKKSDNNGNSDSTFTFELSINNSNDSSGTNQHKYAQFWMTEDIRKKYTKLKVIKTVFTNSNSSCIAQIDRGGIYSNIDKGTYEDNDGICIYSTANISYIAVNGNYNAYARITCVLYND